MKTADAVVVGAGINGASTAFHLAKKGFGKVVLVEKFLLASGGTGKSAAIIRQHYSNPSLVALVKRSVEIFQNFEDLVGGDPGFVDCGWAFLVPEYASEAFARNMAMQQEAGIVTREISPQDLREMEPRIDLSDVARIAYEPHSGYADPHGTTYAYCRRFTEMGGELLQMTAVGDLVVENNLVRQVRTSRGDIATNIVVIAAGPWSAAIARNAGIDLPIQVTREEEIIVETADAGGPPRLVFSDMAKAIYYRPESYYRKGGGTRTVVGRGYPKEYETVDPDHYRESVDIEFIEETSRRFSERFPVFSNALFVGSYTGLYDVTPDWNPILGRSPVQGIYLCAGFSGHGFKIGPAIGEMMAEEVVEGEAASVDIRPFRLSRFQSGDLLEGAYGGNRA